jgi:FO synthase
VADDLRQRVVGDAITFVHNRNINYTNVCTFKCRFCAFSKGPLSLNLRGAPYLLDLDEITRRVAEAEAEGATEVCLQGGIHPNFDGDYYLHVLGAVRAGSPDIHIHGFTALEVTEGARRSEVPLAEYLTRLKEAGLKTLPGTAAEILDDDVRALICPDKINTEEWLEAHRTAHSVGLRSNITIMFGSVEQPVSWARHIVRTRDLQRETGGFTEFVPLSFVHEEAPMTLRQQLPELRPGPTGDDVIRLYAISRLMLGTTIRNLQVSWVKDGMRQAQWLLSCGANDFGGTLINESISTSAGASYGQLQTPSALRRAIRDAGRIPVERSTRYDVLRTFPREPGPDERDLLDGVDDAEAVFGSYDRLTRDERFRFRLPVAAS